MAMFNSYVSLPEGSWFYMHWELAILRYCGDILSMFETQDFKAKSQNIEGIELSNLTQQLPCRMGWRFAGRRRNAQISEVLTWHLALPSSGGRPGGWDCMIRFLAANLPFFGWHFLFSRGVSKIASEFDVLFGHQCVLKKTQITHLKASLRSHKDTFGGNSGPLGSATPNTVGSQLCCVSHPHLETKSRTEITKHINRSGLGTAPKHSVWLHSIIDYSDYSQCIFLCSSITIQLPSLIWFSSFLTCCSKISCVLIWCSYPLCPLPGPLNPDVVPIALLTPCTIDVLS